MTDKRSVPGQKIYKILWIILPIAVAVSDDKRCERMKSRVVQNFIETEILPVYERQRIQVPTGCPFNIKQSIYTEQESMKHRENPGRWTCIMCGKSFYEERFLDQHLHNRHAELELKGSDVLCLADFCDLFRCDVLSRQTRPNYWERALCNDADLREREEECHRLVKRCVPDFLEFKDKRVITDTINTRLCKFLNCKDYWELPDSSVNPISTALYAMAFIVLSVGVVIYYYIAYTHFYTDDSLLEQLKLDERQGCRHVTYSPIPGHMEIRHRMGHS